MSLTDYANNTLRRARASLIVHVIEIGGGLIVLAILVGDIALPLMFTVNTSTWGATNILIWGVTATVALAAVIMGLIGYFRARGASAE
jgi:hypothetical protein